MQRWIAFFAVGCFVGSASISNAATTIFSENFERTGGPANGSYRNVVTNNAEASPIDLNAGLSGGSWSMREVDPQSRIRLYGFDNTRGDVLVMDDTTGDSTFSLNEAILTLNLSDKTNVSLSFEEYDSDDEQTVFSGTPPAGSGLVGAAFTGSRNADGVAISDGDGTWYPILNFANHDGSWLTYSGILLDTFADAIAGLDFTSTFMIKFQQYDNYPHGSDARKFDNILVTGDNVPGGGGGGNSAVPEPSTLALLQMGILGLLVPVLRRRRLSRQSAAATEV